ncbi:hypothetical protein [Sciscionella sediminilitoris]|uniref:hypothetical protein n=1 Tax=Sciscionella sediminilitoris TaxID=1445613 RepID=UPI0004DED3B4|nr:hypothetical protein [Sciscionella sp. SE31]
MPLSTRLARFNRTVTNPILGRLAPWCPAFGVIYHRGRRSGREYHNPICVFRRRDGHPGFVVALTYGSRTDWVRNVLAAGECELVTRRRRHRLTEPALTVEPDRAAVPAPVRVVLTLAKVTEFLYLSPARE